MKNKMWKAMGLLGLLASLSGIPQVEAKAAEIAVETSTTLYAKMDMPVSVREAADTAGTALSLAGEGQTYEVVESPKDGWLKIKTPEGEGYIESGAVTLIEKTQEKVDKSVLQRQKIVDYALQFVGGRYVYGGVNPKTGVDCSGFTSYVLRNAAGVNLSHSSKSQSREGRSVSYEEARAGDLVFYGKNGSINHVALYMGDGRVVHASTEKTGIIVTNVMYRKPVKFVRVLN
ncbi:MAG: C40 family peptidase [Hungatella sp.]|jgi:cell wall-associated NlpC family hydrolase|uniref:NlpC/P60 family protein n=1 Tax=Clostridium sp. NkU-1 TaxID=1095009 RepID=UPI0006D0A8EE|nr:C40 family peptidase [Hungatella sp.]MDR1769395.1 C40 family peptidase [Hungatella sp.]MDR2022961.1 C40 family peptidase [Hungatella sp.]